MQISPEDYQRYSRALIQTLNGALISYGFAAPDATWLPVLSGALGLVSTFLWQVYSNRPQAKVNEVATLKQDDGRKLVQNMDVNDAKIAALAPANVSATPTAKL